MFNDNAFPNAGSITGSGGSQVTGSGIFLFLDYGQCAQSSIADYFVYQTGEYTNLQGFQFNSITGSGGAQITGSGIYFYTDYLQYASNSILVQIESPDSGNPSPTPSSPFKPYAFFYKKR